MNDSPHPHVVFAFGLLIINLDPERSSTKSRVEPNKYGYEFIEKSKNSKLIP